MKQPDGKDLTLYGRYDNNGNKPATPGFDYDDSLGYRLASVVWKDMDWTSLSRKITERYIAQNDANTWRLFAYSMLLTEQPQMTEIWNTKIGGGHAMVVYRIFEGHLYVADPNYPANTERRIEYADGKFTAYSSGENAEEIAKAIAEGKPLKEYDKITYVAKTALSDWDKIGAHWAEFKNKTIGNDYFPAYTITYKDDKGMDQELKDGYISQGNLININVNCNFVWYLNIYSDGKPLTFDAHGNIALKPGNNRLGIYVTGKTGVDKDGKDIYQYVDFKYINVIAGPTITSLSPNTGPVGTAVTITGTGFGTTQGTVTFNGTAATVTAWSDTEITTTVPTGATTGNVVVTVNDVASNGKPFTVTYTVTASAGTGGTISPSSATVNSGATTSFTVTPNTGYSIASVTGCGGTLTGNTYTTGPITANCTVSASFNLYSSVPCCDANGITPECALGGGPPPGDTSCNKH